MCNSRTKANKARCKNTKNRAKMVVTKAEKSEGLEKNQAMNGGRWRMEVREIATGVNPATSAYGEKQGSKLV